MRPGAVHRQAGVNDLTNVKRFITSSTYRVSGVGRCFFGGARASF